MNTDLINKAERIKLILVAYATGGGGDDHAMPGEMPIDSGQIVAAEMR